MSRTEEETSYLEELRSYFETSDESTLEKLRNFTKFVPRQALTRFLSRYEVFKKVINVQGSIVECGVRSGGGLMAFAQFSAIHEPVNYQRKIIGFDTFSGFPEVHDKDVGDTSEELKVGAMSGVPKEDLDRAVELYDRNRFLNQMPKVDLIKGDGRATIPQFLKDNPHTVVSLLYLDFDLYEPTKVALENIVPRIPKGGIIAFDELNSGRWPGETRAVVETLGIDNLKLRRSVIDSFMSYAVLE